MEREKRRTRLSENRPLAWVVLFACVLGSVVGLGGAGLARQQRVLEEVFYSGASDGQQTGRSSMDAYLDRSAECVQVMLSEGKLLLGEDNAVATEMAQALAEFAENPDLDARYAAYTRLQSLSDQLYNAIYGAQLEDAQRVNFKRAYDDFWGSDKYIRLDPYREMAAKYNHNLKGFPASAVAGLWGIDPMNSFGG